MEPKGTRPKHQLIPLQWVSKVILLDNSLAQTHLVIHLKDPPSQDMPNPVMGVNHQLSLDMGPTMDHHKLRNLQPIPLFMVRHNNHLALLEVMASLPLCSLDTHILSLCHLAIPNQIQVHSDCHHLGLVLQVLNQGMVRLMVRQQLVKQVMDRGCNLTTLLMVVDILSLQHILQMAMLAIMLVRLMILQQHHSLFNRVELQKHRHKLKMVVVV